MDRLTLESVMDYRVDMRHCRHLLCGGSKSFYAASLLLPGFYRAPATALYAFCRIADDAIDEGNDPQRALDMLNRRLDQIYAGRPENDPVDRALTGVVERFDVPDTLPRALLEGFQWDREGRRYETLSDVYRYSARVAGTVGVMMAVLMGVRNAEALARASDLGVAMQLTNIARDVGEDARAGRLYLPLAWLEQERIDVDDFLAAPRFNEALGKVIHRLLDDAETLYDRSVSGIQQLPRSCQPGIFAARSIYREIGRQLLRSGLDSINTRTVVSTGRKVALLSEAIARVRKPGDETPVPPLEETRFLVEAAERVETITPFFAAS
ncbi:MAG: phytoene/squalene synthase family protein [Pseudomonadota bacterium]